MKNIDPSELGRQMGTVSVSEITSIIKNTLEGCFVNLTITGEISGFKKASSGHIYFTLKDETACISCVMWRTKAILLNNYPKNGDKVVVHGNISVYPARGSYQIVCSTLQQYGVGDILAELEKRKKEYQAEGLFDENKKKPIPTRPKKIVIITSSTGAALHDILMVLKRRNSGIDILILPAAVQGPNSEKELVLRLQEANEFLLGDVIIIGRGGGSIEDLLSFSSDSVVRAISDSTIPVISAVGHEIDWALSDFVADLRSPTPSAAAEMVCKESFEEKDRIQNLKNDCIAAIRSKLNAAKLRFSLCNFESQRYVLENRISTIRMTIDNYNLSWNVLLKRKAEIKRADAERLKSELKLLSPKKILDRGFSIVTDKNGKVVKAAKKFPKGSSLNIQFANGSIMATSEGEKDGI